MALWKLICRLLEWLGLTKSQTKIDGRALTEYELLIQKLGPAMRNFSLADLNDIQIPALARESRVGRQAIENLRQSARLARDTRIPAEIFYVFVREGHTFDLDRLLNLERAQIETAVTRAVRANIIPTHFKDSMRLIEERLEEIRLEKGLLVRQSAFAKLINEADGKPLPGLTVRVIDVNAQPKPRDIDSDFTGEDGSFSFTYITLPNATGTRNFELNIYDHHNKQLATAPLEVEIGWDEPYAVKVTLAVPEIVSPLISEVTRELGLALQPDVEGVLNKYKILSFADVLSKGGLQNLPELEAFRDDEVVKKLDQHATLSLLPTDTKTNAALISNDYGSIHAIAKSNLKDIEKVIKDKLKAAQAYYAAKNQARYLDNLITEYRVNKKNGRPIAQTSPLADSRLSEECECKDCQSAVSPLAYLADLLDYAVTHIRNNDKPIEMDFLTKTFHQPFGELPASCASSEERIRQVRIAVEVLRNIIRFNIEPGFNDPKNAQRLQQAFNNYVLEAYKALLIQVGTSYDELRLASVATPEKREELRARLAIQRRDGTARDELTELLLSPSELTELNIERLFGLHDTVPEHRLSRGAKISRDPLNQLRQWTFENIAWRRTTNLDGRIYISIPRNSDGVVEVNVYRDPDQTNETFIASGTLNSSDGGVVLAEENLSGVSGECIVKYEGVDRAKIVVAAVPEFLSWRLNHLRSQWLKQDWPADSYSAAGLPFVDPDVIGPDDLRNPDGGNEAFKLWLKRRDWVDDRLSKLRSLTKTVREATVLDLQGIRDAMVAPLAYETTNKAPWSSNPTLIRLHELQEKLVSGQELEQVTQEIENDLHLTMDSFGRLMAIKAKADAWENAGGSQAVTADEWEEVVSILAQAQKRTFFAKWREDEDAIADLFSPKFFWISISEPVEGAWPAERPTNQPWIDPDLVNEQDLPQSNVGDAARQILNNRRTELKQAEEEIKQRRESSDFEGMLTLVFGNPPNVGDPPARTTWVAEITRIKNELVSSDQATAAAAGTHVENDLHLAETDFDFLSLIADKDFKGQTEPAARPTVDEWNKLYSLLTRARKARELFTRWITEEDDTSLTGWNFRKARLPQWRASAEQRVAWQQASRARSRAPIIDPDLVQLDNLITPRPGDRAYDLWKSRSEQLLNRLIGYRLRFIPFNPQPIDRINLLLGEALGISDLNDLRNSLDTGELSTARLEQLNTTRAELAEALKIRGLASTSQLGEEEWNSFYDILLRIHKRRLLYAKWLNEERAADLTLGPDFFQLSEPVFAVTPQPSTAPAHPWRANPAERREWEATLQSRIDQEKSLIDAHWAAVSAVEGATLPLLRDALIKIVTGSPDLPAGAKLLTDRFLLDMAVGGCQVTTRVSQAIETIQVLIWSLRTGQLKDTYPSLELEAEDFDEEWKWLGSYATWRAAMMVFLYPENILVPTLRRQQTPAFREMVESFRNMSQLIPQELCRSAASYASYFRDVMNLKVEATCTAATSFRAGCSTTGTYAQASRSLFYMFARSTVTNLLYWGIYDPAAEHAERLSFWQIIPGFDRYTARTIVGATHYVEPNGKNFLYLFVDADTIGREPARRLVLVKFRLDDCEEGGLQKSWKPGVQELLIPFGTTKILLCPNAIPQDPPLVVIQSGKYLFVNHLSDDGNGWDLSADYSSTLFRPGRSGTGNARYFERYDDWLMGAYIPDMFQPSGPQLETYTLEGVVEKGEPTFTCITFFFSTRSEGFDYLSSIDILTRRRLPGGNFPGLAGQTFNEESETWNPVDAVTLGDIQMVDLGRWGGLFSPNNSNILYVFVQLFEDWYCHTCTSTNAAYPFEVLDQVSPVPLSPGHVITHSGIQPDGELLVAFEQYSGAVFLARLAKGAAPEDLTEAGRLRIAPQKANIASTDPEQQALINRTAFELRTDFSPEDLQFRRWVISSARAMNVGAPIAIASYLNEAYLFVPVLIALRLHRDGEYVAALDWFRLVYDYTTVNEDRWIYSLPTFISLAGEYERSENWLADPINPHAVADFRRQAHLRFVLISLIRCLLDFADAEFTQDTLESIARARTLYQTALELLDAEEIRQDTDECQAIIGELVVQIGESQTTVTGFADSLRRIPLTTLKDVSKRIKSVLTNDPPADAELLQIRQIVADGQRSRPPVLLFSQLHENARLVAGKASQMMLTQSPVALNTAQIGVSIAGRVLKNQSLKTLVDETKKRGTTSRTKARGSSNQGSTYLSTPSYQFCVPPNPLISSLRFRADLNLFKLRTCRNIAGLERQLDPYSAPTDTVSGLPSIGPGGQLVLPGAARLLPTLYRHKTLIERAKQLAGIAQQMEATFLSLLERLDAEDFNVLKARQDARTARATVRLQDLRVQEADDGVDLATLQKGKATVAESYFSQLIAEGTSPLEEESLRLIGTSQGFQWAAAIFHGAAAVAEAALLQPSALSSLAAEYSTLGSILSTEASIYSTLASYERRLQEWNFQKTLAQQDVRIGDMQITLANDRVRIVGQEREIATMQADHADEVVEFLNTKFTSRDLYDWMSGILEGVYRYFLQQTTAIARLAENQLAFERQQVPPAFIQGDYWTTPNDGVANADPNSETADRRGLTGSARLLQDIYRLDQYAFETDRRKLQLTKTISLARLDAVAFQRFRQTGVMLFATPMEMFDRDFPGHYLRLIKRARTSVIALIPPTEGIKATLSTLGISRVVIGGDLFQTTVVNRGPESVALTSPINATGLFELEAQNPGEMLLPFEGLGVDSTWEFRMPRAANNFDFSTIADVLLTIEYTALDSFVYRRQMIQELDRSVSVDRPFSFRHQFADQWYDFHNADLVAPPQQPMVVRFTTRREDFPPNVDELRIQHVTLYFAFKAGANREIEATLGFTEKGPAGRVEGNAKSTDGLFSTRQANAASWTVMFGKSPMGEWQLALPNTQEMRERFKNDEIEDILFVITFSGTTPDWPSS